MFFTGDFYPTPPEVIEIMIGGLSLTGKVILEPQAGSGNIVKALQHAGAKEVIACENDPQLVKITQSLCRVVCSDFLQLTSDKISHIDFIVMNPPFSKADEHILHAYKIAPEGCQIITLCNSSTLKNDYSKTRKELASLVETYGQVQELGDCFSTAERKTEVEVTLIRLHKPGESTNEFEGFFMDEYPEEEQANGLMSYNLIRDIVNRYVKSVQIFDEQLQTAVRLSEMTGEFYGGNLGFQVTRNSMPIQRNEFKKGMQKAGWQWIFSKMNMKKYATRSLREDINKFVETQENVPFTMRNIYHMLDMVIQTAGQRMDKAILEVFDKVTSYHDDNKYGLPGFKTNSHFLLTKLFIVPDMTFQDQFDKKYYPNVVKSFRWHTEMIDDLIKALCYLNGQEYNDMDRIDFLRDKPYGEWFEWNFFRIKCFKKGTVHFEFKDENVWTSINQRVAKLKGYPLPEKKEQTAYQRRQNGHKEPVKPAYKPTPQKPVVLSTFQI